MVGAASHTRRGPSPNRRKVCSAIRILWHSNFPGAHSGYGSQTRQVGRRLAQAGHDVSFSANDGTRGDRLWEGHRVYGSGTDRYSRDTVAEDIARSGADWTITLFDPWVYTDASVDMVDPFRGNDRVMGWVPVDHYPIPPSMMPWVQAHPVIAMSRFGYNALREASALLEADGKPGLTVHYAPHAIESVFRPTPVAPGFGAPFRKVIGLPDGAYLVGIVAANTGSTVYDRKGFGDMLQAAVGFMAERPDVHLYLHTLQHGHQGINLPMLLRVLGADPARIIWADQYLLKKAAIRDEDMAAIYSSFDVLLAPSRGEGFGLPVIEAQACGVPVIVSNWTAQAELVGEPWSIEHSGAQRWPSGWMVSVQPDYDDKHASFYGKPNVVEILAALQEAHARRGDPELREAALAKAAPYAADAVFATHWRPILAEMAARLDKPTVNLAIRPRRKKRAA